MTPEPTSESFCTSCGAGVHPNAILCPSCGANPAVPGSRCRECGTPRRSDPCPECGDPGTAVRMGSGGSSVAPWVFGLAAIPFILLCVVWPIIYWAAIPQNQRDAWERDARAEKEANQGQHHQRSEYENPTFKENVTNKGMYRQYVDECVRLNLTRQRRYELYRSHSRELRGLRTEPEKDACSARFRRETGLAQKWYSTLFVEAMASGWVQ